jgi:hypothetical protein
MYLKWPIDSGPQRNGHSVIIRVCQRIDGRYNFPMKKLMKVIVLVPVAV